MMKLRILTFALIAVALMMVISQAAMADCPCVNWQTFDEGDSYTNLNGTACTDVYAGRMLAESNITLLWLHTFTNDRLHAIATYPIYDGSGRCDYIDDAMDVWVTHEGLTFGEYQACRKLILNSDLWIENCPQPE